MSRFVFPLAAVACMIVVAGEAPACNPTVSYVSVPVATTIAIPVAVPVAVQSQITVPVQTQTYDPTVVAAPVPVYNYTNLTVGLVHPTYVSRTFVGFHGHSGGFGRRGGFGFGFSANFGSGGFGRRGGFGRQRVIRQQITIQKTVIRRGRR